MAEIRIGPRARLMLGSLLLTVSATAPAAPMAAVAAFQDSLRSQSQGIEAMMRRRRTGGRRRIT